MEPFRLHVFNSALIWPQRTVSGHVFPRLFSFKIYIQRFNSCFMKKKALFLINKNNLIAEQALNDVCHQRNLNRVFLINSRVLSKWSASIFNAEEVTENESSTSIIFYVTMSLLFALMSLILLILSSFVFMSLI